MSMVPRVTADMRQRVCLEFDDRGPDACIADVILELERTNPEFLRLAQQQADALGPYARLMSGFAMFYRLLLQSWPAKHSQLSLLPQVTFETRHALDAVLRDQGPERFLAETLDQLERNNPELLRMAHGFAERQADYVGVMLAFAVLYRTLVEQSGVDRAYLH